MLISIRFLSPTPGLGKRCWTDCESRQVGIERFQGRWDRPTGRQFSFVHWNVVLALAENAQSLHLGGTHDALPPWHIGNSEVMAFWLKLWFSEDYATTKSSHSEAEQTKRDIKTVQFQGLRPSKQTRPPGPKPVSWVNFKIF